MSHDESLHVYYSWLFSVGQGYQHTPTTHGPLQFHILALIYFLFGDNDFTARLPYALASIFTVAVIFNWRRYLGRAGMLVASAGLLISPYMLYYGRYARNEAYVVLLGVLTLYAILRYLETGKKRYLFLLTIVTALHFTAKETAFIYTAQALLFLAFLLTLRISKSLWKKEKFKKGFIAAIFMAAFFVVVLVGFSIFTKTQAGANLSQTPANFPIIATLIILSVLSLLTSVILLLLGYGWKDLCRARAFDMLVLLATFVLPQLSPLPVKALGWDPLDYAFTWPGWNWSALWSQGPVKTASIVLGINYPCCNCRLVMELETMAASHGPVLEYLYFLLQQRF